jgi:hypothetical protein
MSRPFQVFVTGIAGFVEDYRRVVAVNAPQPRSMKITEAGSQREIVIPAHFPYLRVPFDYVDEESKKRMITHDWNVSAALGVFPPFDTSLTRKTLVQFLRSREVVLPDSETEPSVDETELRGRMPSEDAGDETSALWLPTLSSLGASATMIDPKHVVEDPDPNFVAAYIRFPSGVIETARTSDYKFGATSLDGHASGTLNQAVALLMVCTMDVPDDAFDVTCRSYQGQEDIVITFSGNMPNPWMVFVCSSLEDAFQLPTNEDKYGTDFHFRLVYELVQGPFTNADIALPKSIAPPPGGRPLGAGKCVPPRFGGGGTGGK